MPRVNHSIFKLQTVPIFSPQTLSGNERKLGFLKPWVKGGKILAVAHDFSGRFYNLSGSHDNSKEIYHSQYLLCWVLWHGVLYEVPNSNLDIDTFIRILRLEGAHPLLLTDNLFLLYLWRYELLDCCPCFFWFLLSSDYPDDTSVFTPCLKRIKRRQE